MDTLLHSMQGCASHSLPSPVVMGNSLEWQTKTMGTETEWEVEMVLRAIGH